jgi:hypothetical protein
MSILSWGKPKAVEIGKLSANDETPTTWKELPEIVQNTAKLTPQEGNKIEAIEEGGGVVDTRVEKNKYSFECELFVKKGDKKPIEDEDGVVIDNYAIRLTPEDPTTEGFILEKTSVNCVETWTSAEGKRWKYIFSGLKPKAGKILKPYPNA